jgi:hypothetical protein
LRGGIDTSSFFVYNCSVQKNKMDKEKLKLIIKNFELLLDSLKSEVYSDSKAYTENINQYKNMEDSNYTIGEISDYDEVFEDDDE